MLVHFSLNFSTNAVFLEDLYYIASTKKWGGGGGAEAPPAPPPYLHPCSVTSS